VAEFMLAISASCRKMMASKDVKAEIRRKRRSLGLGLRLIMDLLLRVTVGLTIMSLAAGIFCAVASE
jgi:hypothetical protein